MCKLYINGVYHSTYETRESAEFFVSFYKETFFEGIFSGYDPETAEFEIRD